MPQSEEKPEKDKGVEKKQVLKSLMDKLEKAEIEQGERVVKEKKTFADFFEEEEKRRQQEVPVKVKKENFFVKNRKGIACVICIIVGLLWLVAGVLSLQILPIIMANLLLLPAIFYGFYSYIQRVKLEQMQAAGASKEEEPLL